MESLYAPAPRAAAAPAARPSARPAPPPGGAPRLTERSLALLRNAKRSFCLGFLMEMGFSAAQVGRGGGHDRAAVLGWEAPTDGRGGREPARLVEAEQASAAGVTGAALQLVQCVWGYRKGRLIEEVNQSPMSSSPCAGGRRQRRGRR